MERGASVSTVTRRIGIHPITIIRLAS
ncbi:hypothetical protein [Rhizobium sp. NFACC06-2]